MKFSLIVTTLNRVKEVDRLFQSLLAQADANFEVILIDQSGDERFVKMVNAYRRCFPIVHHQESTPGHARAINIGFQKAKGDIVAFPDDDCIYPKELLKKVARFFERHAQWDGLITRVFDLEEDKNAFKNCGDEQSQEVDYWKAYRVAVSCAIFCRAAIAGKIHFNEKLGNGSGTPWGSGDETDFVFRCLDAGYRYYYDADLTVRHPNPFRNIEVKRLVKRAYRYGVGHGYFLATHDFLSPKILKAELNDELGRVLPELWNGNWQMASYALIKGIGTHRGYWAGLKELKNVRSENPISINLP